MSDELRNAFEGIYVHGVPREMTPELAQQVLDAATGTPFEERTNALEALDAYTVHPAVKELLIEAPALARVVAGLTEEWGVEARHYEKGYGWFEWGRCVGYEKNRSRESCEAFIEGRKNNPGFEYRLVRQYVSPTEVVE